MSSRWLITRVLVCLTVFSVSSQHLLYAQNQYAGRPGRQSSRTSSMKIIEASQDDDQTHYFTIVGAVHRSGVYSAEEHRVSLTRLLDSAGGFTAVDRPTIRVIGGGRERYRFLYNPNLEKQPNVQSGEVIVVLPSPGQTTTQTEVPLIPVACIGLEKRPVVLPLSADIRTADELLARLQQSDALNESVRILDPYGRTKTRLLAPGSVIFCNPLLVNHRTLANTQKFPPAVPMASPSEQNPISNQVRDTFEHSMVIAPAPLNSAIANPVPKMIENQPLQGSPPTQSSSMSTETLSGPPIEKTQISRDFKKDRSSESPTRIAEFLTEPEPATKTQLQSYDLPLLELKSGTVNAGHEPLRVQPILKQAPAPPEIVPIENVQVAHAFSGRAKPLAAVPFPQTQQKNVQRTSSEKSLKDTADSDPSVSENQESNSSILPIALVVALLGCVCLTLSILWSRHDRHQLRNQTETTQSKKVQATSGPSEEQSRLHPVATILNRSIPMIEEEVVVPSEIQLHGEPIGQKRMVYHDNHESLQGPYFAKRSSKKTVAQAKRNDSLQDEYSQLETAARHRIDSGHREMVTKTESSSPSEVHDSVVQPVENQKLNSAFDVVEPVHDGSVEAPGGPLERALRILAQEQRS